VTPLAGRERERGRASGGREVDSIRQMLLRSRWFVLPLAVLSLATPAAAADVVSVSASGAGVTATLTTTPDAEGAATGTTIVVTGGTSYGGAVPSVDGTVVAANGVNLIKVAVRDLTGGGAPEVVISSFTGGAHCCFQATVLAGNPSGGFSTTVQDFASEGYTLQTIDGRLVFVSADPRFEYAFTSYAGSVEPIQLWQFTRSGLFANRTRSFRSRVLVDLSRKGREYRRVAKRTDLSARGALAGYLGDLLLVGRREKARAVLSDAVQSGVLVGRGDIPARAAPFVRSLKRALVRWGYGRL
jgi:hypothetical protein